MDREITTIIITKNNESVIKDTIESVIDYSYILIADLESKDSTVKICKEFNIDVCNFNFNYNYSDIKNYLINKSTTDWILSLEPGEIVTSGHEFFSADKTDEMYRVSLLNDDLLIKQTRLFKKTCKFKGRVFEFIDPDLSEQTLPIIITGNSSIDKKTIIDCIMKWKDEEPLSAEPDYYLSNIYLMYGDNDQFLVNAERFLFQKKEIDSSVILTKYYISSILKKKNPGRSLQLILECISAYPLMAEFWCLLGDLYLFSFKEYDRAYHFYQNAVILGSQRLVEDVMPMEISKYHDYPQKMMRAIENAIKATLREQNFSNEERKK